MARKVELMYFEGCPSYKTTLEDIQEVVEQEGLDVRIELVKVDSEKDAQRLRFPGSPTVRVDGVDVDVAARQPSDFGLVCRLYRAGGRLSGSPSREMLRRAIKGEPS
ncbi:MAG: hypothetical protein JRN34_03465 [Nitrososphaerota archaeon]|jgi:hypothetical protein|nr:hypothetical protein [Nitrososphaerota archaeon]MDG6941965.1 hypothetical protein [Nitrososphaerota archaeon]